MKALSIGFRSKVGFFRDLLDWNSKGQMFLAWFFALGATLSLGCSNSTDGGGGGGSAPVRAMTTEKMEEVAYNLNHVHNVGAQHSAQSQSQGGPAAIHPGLRRTLEATSGVSQGHNRDQVLRQAFARCRLEYSNPQVSESNRFRFGLKFVSSGEDCPIQANYSINGEFTPNSISIDDLSIQLKILEPQIAQENDVYEANIKGHVKGAWGADGTGTATGRMDGKILSVKYGSVGISAALDSSQSRLGANHSERTSFTIQGELSDLTFSQSIDANGKHVEVYTINGRSVTKNEYDHLKQKLGLLGQATSMNSVDSSSRGGASKDGPNLNQPNNGGSSGPFPQRPNPDSGVNPNPNPEPFPESPSTQEDQELAECSHHVSRMRTWSAMDAYTACYKADLYCVLVQLQQDPYLTPPNVNAICRR